MNTISMFLTDIISDSGNVPGGVIFIENKTIVYNFNINGSALLCSKIHFKNTIFKENVTFSHIDKFIELIFDNCQFPNNLNFDSIVIVNNKKKNTQKNIIKIVNSHINILSINNCQFEENSIHIFESKVNNIFCEKIQTNNNGSIYLFKTEISELISFNYCNLFIICISECTLLNRVIYLEPQCDFLDFNNNIVEENFVIGLNEINHLTFKDNKIKKSIYIDLGDSANCTSEIDISSNVISLNCFVRPSILFNKDEVFNAPYIKIKNNHILGKLILSNGEIRPRLILNKLDIYYSSFSKGEIEVENITINHLNVSGYCSSENRLSLNSIVFNTIVYNNIINSGVIQFLNCILIDKMLPTKFSVKNSSLGDMRFINFNIDRFQSIELINTDLSNITISPIPQAPISETTITPQTSKLKIRERIKQLFKNVSEDDEAVKTLKQKRDIFRQLKIVCEKSGDRASSLYYKSLEMKALHREYVLTKTIFNNDRMLLTLSKTNDYGLDYIRPICWAVGLTIFFYTIIFTGISPQLEFKFTLNPKAWWESIAILAENFPLMFKMLNPVYDLNRFPEPLEINSWVWPFEYLHKLTLAFFIFQTISAFRKFVK